MQAPRQEEILEVNKESNIFDAENEEIETENYNAFDNGIQDDEITEVDDENQDEEGELGRGKGKKSRNPRYFNSDTVNTFMSDNYQRNGHTNGQQEPQNKIDNDVTPIIFKYVLAQYRLKQCLRKYGILAE